MQLVQEVPASPTQSLNRLVATMQPNAQVYQLSTLAKQKANFLKKMFVLFLVCVFLTFILCSNVTLFNLIYTIDQD